MKMILDDYNDHKQNIKKAMETFRKTRHKLRYKKKYYRELCT
jgi:hypothetical protein